MERSTAVEENHQSRDSNLVSKSAGSLIKIDSISIDLVNVNDKIDSGKCEHFSIRGYVSEIRNKDWKIGWPFALDGNHDKSEEQTCLLPPLTIPRFRWWSCQNCQREMGAEDTANTRFKSNGTCSHGSSLGDATMLLTTIQHAPNLNILEGGNVDANPSTDVNGNDYCHSLSGDKKEKKVEAVNNPIKGHEIGSEVNRNQDIPVSTCAATKVISNPMQERCHADDIEALNKNCNGSVEFGNPGCGSHEVADIEPVDTKNSSEICQTGKQISANDQHAELMIASRTSGIAGIDEALNAVKNHSSKHPSSELDEYDYESSESAEILVRNNFQDHHPDKSGGLPRRKTRKVRLMTELLGGNGKVNTDTLRTEDSLSNAISGASAEVGMISAFQGRVAVQGNLTSGLGQNRKRKLPRDEEWNPPEMSSPTNTSKKVLKTFNGGASTTDAIASSGPEERAFTGIDLQISLKSHLPDSRIERSPIIGKKKNKTTKVVHESLSLALFQENVPKEIHEKIGDASKGDAADSVFFKPVHAGFTGRGKDPFTLPALKMEGKSSSCKKKNKMPQVDDEQASLIFWNNGMLREGPSTSKDVDNMQTGSIPVPFQSGQDEFTEEGLLLSLNNMSAQRYDNKSIPQLTEGRASLLPWQKGTPKEDQIKRKDVRTNFVRDSSIPSKSEPDAYFHKKSTHKMPFLNEKQKHASQVQGGGCSLTQQIDFCGTSNKGKAIEIQEHSAVSRKFGDQRANNVSELGALDDIPMEIVELMAKNQYERCLPDAENDKQPLETANNTGDAQMMDLNKAYGNGEFSLLQEETTHRRKPRAKNGGNGKITRSENVGTTKQKTVDYFSQNDRNHFNKSQLGQTYPPPGFGPFPQCQEKPSSGVQYSATSSSRHTSGQNSQWIGKMVGHTSSHACMPAFRACNTCQGVPRQSEAATHIWSSMIPSHMPFVYNIPQKCADQSTSTNNDVLSHCPSSLPKGNMNGDHNLNFSNPKASNLEKQNGNFDSETLSRTRAEHPFTSKHNGMGSLDLYSNDTIPAMDLLSLMHAQSGASIDMNGTPKFLKRPSFPHHHHSKEFPGLPLGGYKTDTMKHPTYDYYGKNHLSENSRECFPTMPTVGASAFSFQHDKILKRATDFTKQVSLNSREKEKTKVSNSPTQNRGRSSQKSVLTSGGLGTNRGSVPGHSMQKMPLPTSDSMAFPFQFHAMENATKYKLEAPSTSGTVQRRKSILETEICTINKNPADFSMPEAGNEYMIAGEDLKFRKLFPSENRSRLIKLDGHKRQRKVTVVKEPSRNRIP